VIYDTGALVAKQSLSARLADAFWDCHKSRRARGLALLFCPKNFLSLFSAD